MSDDEQYCVLMVCQENSCVSPLAAGLLQFAAESKGLEDHLYIDSAGLKVPVEGKEPDLRVLTTAENHGFKLAHQSRQINLEDFEDFNEILVMDELLLMEVLKLTMNPAHKLKVKLITDHDKRKTKSKNISAPEGNDQEQFEELYEQLWYCCMGFLA